MPIAVRHQLFGTKAVLQAYRTAEPKYFRPAARKAADDAGKIVLQAARAGVRRKSGQLRKDLGRKTKALRRGDGYISIVGARKMTYRAYAKAIAAFKAGKRKKKPVLREAWRRLHLEEYGRRAVTVKKKKVLSDGSVIFGKKVKAAPGSGFLRKAMRSTRSEVIAAIRRRMREGLKAIPKR